MKVVLIMLLALITGLCLLSNLTIPFILLALIFYLWLLLEYPEIALFISFLVIIDCFSIMDEDLFRLPYLFRIRDIFFLSIFIPLIIGFYKKDNKIRDVFNNPIAKCISFILFLSIIQIFVTYLRFNDETLNSIIRMGRRYFYYVMFFPALYILLDEKRFKRFSKLFITSVIIFCFLYIVQFLIGPTHKILLKGRVEYQGLQGFTVPRLYISGVIAATLIFHISLMIFLFYKNFKYRVKNILFVIVSGIQTLVTFGRAHIFGVIIGTLFAIFFAKGHMRIKSLFKLSAFLLIAFLAVMTFQILFQPEKDFFKAFYARIASTYNAVTERGDTFGYRIKDSLGRMELIKKNPILGIGFVHDSSDLFAFVKKYSIGIRTGDSGIIDLLIDFGIIGVIWLLVMSFVVLKRSLVIYRETENHFYKTIILGVIAFYFGRLFSFITLEDFVAYDSIVIITFSLVLLEVLKYRISREENVR
jgi:O-antigen ligase